jgi:GcrA cell cycle regulator
MSTLGAGIWATPDLDAALRRKWEDGESCSQIAVAINTEFGTKFTRNAIIGVVTRKALAKRKRKTEARAPAKRSHRKRMFAITTMPQAERPVPQRPPPSVVDQAIPIEQRRTLMQLTNRTCKWPVGDPGTPGFFFCGAEALQPFPYCESHCLRSYDSSYIRPMRKSV